MTTEWSLAGAGCRIDLGPPRGHLMRKSRREDSHDSFARFAVGGLARRSPLAPRRRDQRPVDACAGGRIPDRRTPDAVAAAWVSRNRVLLAQGHAGPGRGWVPG